ncbi:hypothetical protein BS47DRAFT_1433238 [Hydnum rufescens UP504]|uniref:CxC2-like cysteine cluster KDZ transposase-associated domain-containing protein n=1 Tax=Hydnum rufescens UP504 TaxID=1448309 RepID=A0A9P6AGT5_9AGAM|nr:hypothetical protein BS47DRAFT_1433238 [Hydnum rufescens UP504]
MLHYGRPKSNPFNLIVREAVTSHVVISHNGTSAHKQNIIWPPAELPSQVLDSTSVDMSPNVPNCADDEVFDPSNPNHHQMGQRSKTTGNKRYEAALQDELLLEWTFIHDEFLDALLQYDGCGDSLLVNGCPSCQLPGLSGMYRCIECFNHQMLCKDCCVLQHEHLPLHHINVWNGDFFECTTLATMGLKIYLGHTDCLMRKSPASFTIIHTNGIHRVDVVFCGCGAAVHPQQQLLRCGWYPATIHQPQMCATFVIFNHFHLQMLQSKLLANHFIAAIEQQVMATMSLGLKERSWGSLLFSVRLARIPGLTCPAIGNPGPQWISLGTGWAYFIEDEIYKKFLLDFMSEKDLQQYGLHHLLKPGSSGLHSMLLSYDIFCQWIKKQALTGVILKFHLPVHKQQCHMKFSLNLRPGAGCMDGEGIEHNWANINPATNSTKEMGNSLKTKLLAAIAATTLHSDQFHQFNAGFLNAVTDEWLAMVLAWELDNTKPDPYVITASSMTQAQIRLKLVQSERQSHAVGKPELHANWKNTSDVSLKMWLHRVALAQHFSKPTFRSVGFKWKSVFQHFVMIQSAYMAEAMCLIAVMPSRDDSDCHPETQLLRLPSQLPSSTHASNPHLADMERKLRYAQAMDSIAELHQSLIICAHLTKYKVDQVSGQNPNTRAWTLLNKAEAQTNRIAMRYSVAQKSYLTLAGSAHEDDAAQRPRDSPGEGHQTLSWIWITPAAPHGDDTLDMHEALHAEWAKACARMQHWAEEVQLLQEEMRRVLQFSEYHATWWEDQKSLHMPGLLLNLSDGIHVYAAKQASILRNRAKYFMQIWKTPGVSRRMMDDTGVQK